MQTKINNKKIKEFNLILKSDNSLMILIHKLQVINLETLLKNTGELRLTAKEELHIQTPVL